MRTRSQTKAMEPIELEVNIDFDEASQAWNANKKRAGQGYSYVCGRQLANGKSCQCKPVNIYGSISQVGNCRRHCLQDKHD